MEAVRALGAVQAQDYPAAKWALALRTGATEAEIDRLFDDGAILRTHVLRPTWHFVLPEDLDWLLQLSAPRLLERWLRARHRELGLDQATIAHACAIFESALTAGNHLTRPELGAALAAAGVSPEGQRLPHLLLTAEFLRVVTSGARRGRQMTWARFDERAPRKAAFDREGAIVELTRRYFATRGPAQLPDFQWWSGLTAADARLGLRRLEAERVDEVIDGRIYWSLGDGGRRERDGLSAQLLPNFDEYLVAYRDRSSALHPGHDYDPSFFSFGSILSNVVVVDGLVRGGWRKTAKELELRLLGELTGAEKRAVDAAADRAREFFGF